MTETGTIKDFIVKNFLYGEDNGFANDASLLETGIVDSTGFLQIITHVEKEFGIKVKDSEILPGNFETLDKIHAYIDRKINVKSID
jgi:acyl carrier protein